MSSDSHTAWTDSPHGVADTTSEFDIFDTMISTGEKHDEVFDFKELGVHQDPLEWLVEAEPSILPESSLPVFPDLTTTTNMQHVVEETESHVSEDILNSIVDPNVTVQSLFLLP